jgi:predicted aspartyl protease
MIRYPVQIHPLQRLGKLLTLNASVTGRAGDRGVLRLLIDTGASYTIFPIAPLLDLGYHPDQSTVHRPIVTASSTVRVPFIRVASFHCLGLHLQDYPVALYDLPRDSKVDGILGMDFLAAHRAFIATHEAEIYMPIQS